MFDSNYNDPIIEAAKKALTVKQKEMDLDDDGDIDGKDLKGLRKGLKDKDVGTDKECSCNEEVEQIEEAINMRNLDQVETRLKDLVKFFRPSGLFAREAGQSAKKDVDALRKHLQDAGDIFDELVHGRGVTESAEQVEEMMARPNNAFQNLKRIQQDQRRKQDQLRKKREAEKKAKKVDDAS